MEDPSRVVLPGGYSPWKTRGDCYYDVAAGARAVEFFGRFLTHAKGELAGRPFNLEPWQADVIAPLFGYKRPDGSRRYRICFVFVPRKNGKSTLGAGCGLYLLTADGERGAEVYSAAAETQQAGIIHGLAKSMVFDSPALRKRCKLYRTSIVCEATGGSYHVLSADAPTKHGLNPHGIVFDELHAQPSRDLWDVLLTGRGARRQPLVVAITTAGWDRNSICYEQYLYATKVRDGIISDPGFLPVIYEAPKDADWKAPETWAAANPNLGVSITPEFLAEECKKAQETPGYENTFRQLYLNQWTEAAARWLSMEAWDKCAGAVDREHLAGRRCYLGLDLSTTTDLSAAVLLFPPDEEGGYWDALAEFWVPEEGAHRREARDRVPYETWGRQGLIHLTPGNVIDYGAIRRRVCELREEFDIAEIGYDPYNAEYLVNQQLGQEDGFEVVPVRQGYLSLSEPAKHLEKLVVSGRLRHGGNPVLRWHASNVCIRQDPAGNIKPDKAKSTERIDGIAALVNAIHRAIRPIDGLGGGSVGIFTV